MKALAGQDDLHEAEIAYITQLCEKWGIEFPADEEEGEEGGEEGGEEEQTEE
jgi:hypothetical protein